MLEKGIASGLYWLKLNVLQQETTTWMSKECPEMIVRSHFPENDYVTFSRDVRVNH
jgi:hypothetical protein